MSFIESNKINTSDSSNNINLTVIFDFDIDNELDQEMRASLGIDATRSAQLDDDDYNDVCDYYGVPRLDENVLIDLNNHDLDIDNLDENMLCDIISDMYGWLVSSYYANWFKALVK